MEEFEDKIDSLNIINSIATLESDIKHLEARSRYATINQDGIDRQRNDNEAEAKNEQDEQSEAKQEESKYDIVVPRYHMRREINQLSHNSKILSSRYKNPLSNARNVSRVYANNFNNEPYYFKRQQVNGRYQEQDYINDSQLELNMQQ